MVPQVKHHRMVRSIHLTIASLAAVCAGLLFAGLANARPASVEQPESVPPSWNFWPLLILLALIGVAVLVAARWWPLMAGELQLYRMEERDGRDVDVLVMTIPLYGRLRLEAVDPVDARSPDTAARIVVMAHRHLLTGVVRLRVGIRFTALRRGASRDMAEGGRLLILGLDVRHVPAQEQLPPATAALTQPS